MLWLSPKATTCGKTDQSVLLSRKITLPDAQTTKFSWLLNVLGLTAETENCVWFSLIGVACLLFFGKTTLLQATKLINSTELIPKPYLPILDECPSELPYSQTTAGATRPAMSALIPLLLVLPEIHHRGSQHVRQHCNNCQGKKSYSQSWATGSKLQQTDRIAAAAHFSAKAVLSRNAKREGKARREKRDAEEHPQHPQSKEQQSSTPTETSTCPCLAADLQILQGVTLRISAVRAHYQGQAPQQQLADSPFATPVELGDTRTAGIGKADSNNMIPMWFSALLSVRLYPIVQFRTGTEVIQNHLNNAFKVVQQCKLRTSPCYVKISIIKLERHRSLSVPATTALILPRKEEILKEGMGIPPWEVHS
ncbi:hypothetical protein Anapl_01248 [Anas platyrhynchos]|uniref:Uncharacterized protein n=1 Tax=Anas platyrhynchos TaxID=8839 RepID=R0LWS6_ANAPL|nr:hypothetical protein Anapl_01248 [Anas platyrhynchos]